MKKKQKAETKTKTKTTKSGRSPATRKAGTRRKAQPPREAPPEAAQQLGPTAEPLAGPSPQPTANADAAEPGSGQPGSESQRLPAAGTVLRKLDRRGQVRCECEIVAGGVRYGETVFRSLSAAAVAAAKDLGLSARAVNGYTFWGLIKVARAGSNPLAALERAYDRYQERLETLLGQAQGEAAQPVINAIERHVRVLQNLHAEARGA